MTGNRIRWVGALALMVGTAAGCQRLQGKAGAEGTEAAGNTAAQATAANKPSGPCESFAEKLCGEAGDEAVACAAVKQTSALMAPKACQVALDEFAVTVEKYKAERRSCDELVEALCQGVGPDTDTCAMVRDKTKQLDPQRCKGMLEQKDMIVQGLKQSAMEEQMRSQPLSDELQAKLVAGDVPSFGPKDAAVTVVEFSDFECPYCSRAAKVTEALREKYGDKIRFVFRQFPLSFHRNAMGAARASLAAHEQGKFWEYHDRLFENTKQLDVDSLKKHAKEAGLNLGPFTAALDGDKYEDAVKRDIELGNEVAVKGTPTLFVNGKRVSNPTDLAVVSQAIDEALKSATKG